MTAILLALLGTLSAGGLATVVVTKIFDVKLERLKTDREVKTTQIATEASVIEEQGKDAIKAIVALNHILHDEVERLSKALKECHEGRLAS